MGDPFLIVEDRGVEVEDGEKLGLLSLPRMKFRRTSTGRVQMSRQTFSTTC